MISAQPSGANCFATVTVGEFFFIAGAICFEAGIDEEQEERITLIVIIPSSARNLCFPDNSITEISRRNAFITEVRNEKELHFMECVDLFRATTILFFFNRQSKGDTVSVSKLISSIEFCK